MRRCAGDSDHTALSSSLDLAAFASRSATVVLDSMVSMRFVWRAAVPSVDAFVRFLGLRSLCPTCPAYLSCPIFRRLWPCPDCTSHAPPCEAFPRRNIERPDRHPLSGSAGPAVIGSGCGTLSACYNADVSAGLRVVPSVLLLGIVLISALRIRDGPRVEAPARSACAASCGSRRCCHDGAWYVSGVPRRGHSSGLLATAIWLTWTDP